jgi:hypothetical protein
LIEAIYREGIKGETVSNVVFDLHKYVNKHFYNIETDITHTVAEKETSILSVHTVESNLNVLQFA